MVGGSPYYTTIVWAGRTDNQPLNDNVVAANVAAPIWIGLQKFLHEGKTAKEFSTEGLKKVGIDPISGFPRENSNTKEWMSEEQLKILQEAGSKIAKPTYDPRKTTIIENRSAVIERKLKINKLDNRLAVEGKTLAENIEERVCYDFLGEYPDISNWRDPVNAWAGNGGNRCGDTSLSEQDQVKDKDNVPIINSSINSNQSLNANNSATFTTSNAKKIVEASVIINGTKIKNYSNKAGESSVELSYSLKEVNALLPSLSSASIVLYAKDSYGGQSSKTITNVSIPGQSQGGNSGSNNGSGNGGNTGNEPVTYTTAISTTTIADQTPLYINLNMSSYTATAPQLRLINSKGNYIDCNSAYNGNNIYGCAFSYAALSGVFDAGDVINVTDISRPGVPLTQPIIYNGG
jgi:hypothetical protein